MDNFNHEYQPPDEQKAVIRDELAEHNAGRGKGNSASVTALVLGVLSILFCWGCGISVITSVIGVIVGIVGLVQSKHVQSIKIAVAGIVTSGIGLLLGVVWTIIFFLQYT